MLYVATRIRPRIRLYKNVAILGPYRGQEYADRARSVLARYNTGIYHRLFLASPEDLDEIYDQWSWLNDRIYKFWRSAILIIIDGGVAKIARASTKPYFISAENSDILAPAIYKAVRDTGGVLTERGVYLCPPELAEAAVWPEQSLWGLKTLPWIW
jgi:hypothetical protein